MTPSGETVLASLPADIVGDFGQGLGRFLLLAHAQRQVTTERLVAPLGGIGIEIWTPPESLASGADRAPDDRWDAPIAGESAVPPALA